jgi:hypothetical protein
MRSKSFLHGLTFLLIFISCKKQQDYEYPLVYTGDVTDITDTSAVFSARISNEGNYPIVESGFIWGVHPNDNYGIRLKNDELADTYSLKTNKKLLPGKTYYVHAYVQTEFTTSYGREVSFTCSPAQVDLGTWSLVYSDDINYGFNDFVKTSFTIDGITYLAFEDGITFSYDPNLNAFKYELTNAILSYATSSVVYNGKAYLFSGNSIYQFDPITKLISKLSVLNENEIRYNSSSFLIGNNIYVGLGLASYDKYFKDFWKYNISTNKWTQVTSFPGKYREYAFAFSIDGVGYVGGGFNLIPNQWPYPKFNDLWCYLPETDEWIQKESLPFKNEDLFDTQVSNTQNYGYCFYKKNLYEYNATFDIWERMAGLNTSENLYYPHSFISGNKFYVLVVHDYMDDKYFKLGAYEK